MGIFKSTKNVAGILFNFKVHEWVGYDNLKQSTKFIANSAKDVFTPDQAERTETFEEALKRLNVSEEDLKERISYMSKIFILFLALAFCIFAYGIYIMTLGNILGFCISFSLTIYTCTQAFKYHFWMYQMKKRKLGCTLNEWLSGE